MYQTLFLRVIAAILFVFGLIYLFSPALLAAKAGITADPSGLTDIRATYGGFQIGMAIFLLWACAGNSYTKPAVMATLAIFASVGAARFFGVLVDGQLSGFNQIGLAFEVILTLVCAVFLLTDKKNPA